MALSSMHRRAILVALVAASLQSRSFLQQPPPVFRSGANLVEVDVVVTDRSGAPVKGLTADDFEVSEDRKPQKVTALVAIDLPDAGVAPPPVPIASSGSALGSNEGAEGRLLVIAFDEWHLRDPRSVLRARDIATRLVNRLAPTDQVALVSLPSNRFVNREFTNDRASLLKGVGGVLSSAGMPASFSVRTMFGQLRDVARALAPVRQRRKTIVLIGEGADGLTRDIQDPNAPDTIQELTEFIEIAQRANVTIYTIDPRGLDVREPNETFDERQQRQDQEDVNRSLAESTGGRALVNRNTFDRGIAALLSDAGHYYVLGYESPTLPDGRFHRISVRVKRPDVEVRARAGYVSTRTRPTSRTSSAVSQAVSAPVQTYGLPMRALLVPMPSAAASGATVVVLVEIDSAAIPDFGSAESTLELMAVAATRDAKIETSDRSAVRVRQPADAARSGRWVQMNARLDVAPGQHYVRVAVSHAPSGMTGSVFRDIDVPKFAGGALVLSGLVLIPAEKFDVTRTPKLAPFMPAPALARSIVFADESIAAFARVRASRPLIGSIEIVTTLKAPDGRTLFADEQQIEGSRPAVPAGVDVTVPFPKDATRAPGEYALRMEAKRAGRVLASRELSFSTQR